MNLRTPEERFWPKVQKSDSGCWMWTGALVGRGYGNFWDGNHYPPAHVFSWKLVNGEIPDGLFVLHRCDVRACVNPDHLFLGTQRDNIRDMMSKNRHRMGGPSGERNGNSKLLADQVKTIRHLYFAERRSYKEIAEHFSVSRVLIGRIVNNKIWRKAA